ncbi:hypothetical protein MC885_009431 [Smutsia gigantea]|nr:hypothetical protein MC885_009431 [Smutsia gigantea]
MALASQSQSMSPSTDDQYNMSFRKKLLTISSNLEDQDVESLKFLCQDYVSNQRLEKSSSASDIFHHLLAEELLSEEDPFFLAELLYIIRQNSLLRSLHYTKEQVESLLPIRRRVSLFRAISLLAYLKKQALIDEDNLTLLEDLCKKVKPDQIKKIEKYKRDKGNAFVISTWQLCDTLGVINSEKKADMYRMDRKHRGHCVIVNNYSFTSLPHRTGTNVDAECLKSVFQWLGFSVYTYNNVTKKCLEEILQEFKSHPGNADGDCFVFFALTHGKCGAVYSSDEAIIPIGEIMSHFTAQQCPGLAHKPKLFFIQACQGKAIQPSVFIEADAINAEHAHPPLVYSVPNEADFLLGLATVPGYVAYRHTLEGS